MVQPVLDRDENIRNPADKAIAALTVLAALPLVVPIPANLNIVLTASLCVFAGCWKSVKAEPPQDSMSRKDAMKFPLIGSAVLLGLFLLFKFLPKELINTVLTGYFVLIGILAISATAVPFVELLYSKELREKRTPVKKIEIPQLFDEPLDFSYTQPELITGIISTIFCTWYFLKKHWFANNILGLAYAVQGMEHISLGSVSTGVILLSGLFFYDIFWVFCTPVMVSVAKSFDAPIKLLFSRGVDPESNLKPFSMLGLGDIVIPGIFVALMLRYDALHRFRTKYFYSTYAGYVLGLASTILIMNLFEAAQPALLYIVPAIIGSVAAHAAYTGELKQVFAFNEATEAKPKTEKNGEDESVSAGKQSNGKKAS